MANNNAVNAATAPQSFSSSSFSLPGLAAGTASNIVYYGAGGALLQGALPSGGGVVSQLVTYITASGTFTPNSKCLYAVIETFGAGGGGGYAASSAGQYAAGGGGGAGGYSQVAVLVASLLPNISVTVGAAGAGGNGGNGGNGGTSITPFNQATGGFGGAVASAVTIPGVYFATGGAGGVGTSSSGLYQINASGQDGVNGLVSAPIANGQFVQGGAGGNGPGIFAGGKSRFSAAGSAAGFSPVNLYNGGGSGAVSASFGVSALGANGGAGLIIITQFLSA